MPVRLYTVVIQRWEFYTFLFSGNVLLYFQMLATLFTEIFWWSKTRTVDWVLHAGW